MQIECLTEAHFDEVGRFLTDIFGPLDSRKLNPDFLRWKFTVPHPFWPTGRAFCGKHHGEIVAFCGLVPLRFLTAEGEARSSHLIDWAASRRVPGAGLRLYRHVAGLAGSAIGIGGSKDTIELLPRIGSRRWHTVSKYLWPVRPLSTALRVRLDWKAPARLLRDLRFRWAPLGVSGDFNAVPVNSFGAAIEAILPTPSVASAVVSKRTAELLNYWLRCPASQMYGYLIQRSGDTEGYFLVSVVPPSGRIADLWIRSGDPESWRQSFALAFRQAGALPDVSVVEATTGDPNANAALSRMGLRKAGTNPVFLLDPNHLIPDHAPSNLSMADYDGFYV